MRRVLLIVLLAAVASLGLAQQADSSAADEVIAVTKAQWKAEMRKDLAGAWKNIADDYTEFNDEYPTRLDGKTINHRLAEANLGSPGRLMAAEMANEKVQMYGDVAILTYNFIGAAANKDGVVEPTRAKSTRVYVKKDGQWMLVHANFAAAR
ncbi:MAG TPA: DUF4440 domain-containing protein [Terriglobales bacterium]|nr:DUF4440 domain-containing protein [Terriglobales bacterium]